jgi:hypothetical protein
MYSHSHTPSFPPPALSVLAGNAITHIPDNIFSDLASLDTLYALVCFGIRTHQLLEWFLFRQLNSNSITRITKSSMAGLDALTQLCVCVWLGFFI